MYGSRERLGITEKDARRLEVTAWAFTAAVLVHGADHVRRGIAASGWDVFALGVLGAIVEVIVVAAIAARSRWAPLLAVAGGSGLAAGYVFAHFLPERSAFSDPLATAPAVTWLSWAAASVEVCAAVAVAAAGAAALARRPEPRAEDAQGLLDVLRCPYVAVMGLGNALIIILAVARA